MAEGGREASSETRQMEHGQISNTVEVQGFLKNTSQELLELYFENSRRSGGGDMEEVKIRDEVAYITFKDAEVAQRVVSHNRHQVEGQTLTVKLFHPLPPKPCYENRVLIQGLNNAVTEELLRNFLETVTEAEVREFLYGEEEGNVVVTLSDNIDIGQLRKTFQENSIEGAFLRVARVAISNCILLQNIQTSTSHDTVLFYFDNKRRSGGGDVERVEMKADEGYCLVYFEDHSVINRVLSQSHKVDGADLEVHLHHECLGRRSSMNKSDPYLRISNPVNKDGRIDEVENTDNQSNDEDSCSVSSDPDKESDFIEVQERQESEGGTIGIYRIVAFIYPCNKSVSLINEKVENDKTDLIVTPVLLPFSSTGPQNSPFIVTQSTRVLNMYVPLSIDGDQQAEQLLIENIVATLRYSEEKEYGTVRFKINPIGGWKIEPFVKVFLYAINHFFSKSLDTNRWKVYLCTSDLHIFAEMKAAAIDYFECFITAHNKASDAYLVTNGAAPGKAPTTAESKTDSNTPTGVQDQSSGPQSERRKLPQIPELQPTGPNTVTVSSPVIPVGNTSVSFSNLGARPKETKPLEAGK